MVDLQSDRIIQTMILQKTSAKQMVGKTLLVREWARNHRPSSSLLVLAYV